MIGDAARFLSDIDPAILSRIEDAGLNASAPAEQRWMDGWIVRFSPGKAQRARCINAVAAGQWALADKLPVCEQLFLAAGLPLLFRITPFTQPPSLDAQLGADGWEHYDDTRVMVRSDLASWVPHADSVPAEIAEVQAETFALTVGALRGSPQSERDAHAKRLLTSPVPYRGFVWHEDGKALACAQIAIEGPVAGIYDVHTAGSARGRGLATRICEHLLSESIKAGARSAYLQVGADNHAARRIYARLGFVDAYTYHYRRRRAG